jgi:hypothetical protein
LDGLSGTRAKELCRVVAAGIEHVEHVLDGFVFWRHGFERARAVLELVAHGAR